MTRLTGGFRPYLLLSLLCLVLYLPGLASVPPLDRDESRFMQATRQMLESGDFVRIQYQDEMRAKKPVGAYWLQAGSVSLFSAPEATLTWPYRLPSALAAWAAVLMTFAFGRVLLGAPIALLGSALLGGSLMLVTEAHQAKTDAVLLATAVAAQGALAVLYLRARLSEAGAGGGCGGGSGDAPSSKALPLVALVFWVAIGFSILVKGPVVPMVSLLTIAALCIADRKAGWLVTLKPLTGVIVAIAIAAPWFAAISKATDGAFVGEAVKGDLLPKLLGAHESHGGVPGTYLMLATLFFWPGSLLLWPSLYEAWTKRAHASFRFLLAWLVPAWVMFEIIPTKLPHYVLPTYPALALLAAAAALTGAKALGHKAAKAYYAVWAVIGLVLAAAVVVLPMQLGNGFSILSLPAALAIAMATAVPVVLAWKGRMRHAAVALVLTALAAFPVVFEGVLPKLDRMFLSRGVARVMETLYPQDRVAAAGFSEPSLVFLLGTDTVLTNGDGAAGHLAAHPRGMAVVSDKEEAAFLARAKSMNLLVRAEGRVQGLNYSRGKRVTLTIWGVEARR